MLGPLRRPFQLASLSLLAAAFAASPAAAVTRQVFVTSTTGSGDFSTWAETDLKGLAGADEICRYRANHATGGALPKADTYRAWISASDTDAWCHLFGLTGSKPSCDGADPDATTMGPWVRRDGTPFAERLSEMAGPAHRVYQPVLYDENAQTVPEGFFNAWTATDPDGVKVVGTCVNWSKSADAYGDTGNAWMVGKGFTLDLALTCDQSQNTRIYCFEPGEADPLDLSSTVPGSLVFVSSVAGTGDLSSWPDANGQTGLAAGDAICQKRAELAGLPNPGSFVAWLSDQTYNAWDRLTTDGNFVRVDGFLFARGKLALYTLPTGLYTGLNVDELGGYYIEDPTELVWTGTEVSPPFGPYNCQNWGSGSQDDYGLAGSSASSRFTWSDAGDRTCEASRPIDCFSNVEVLFWDNFERGDPRRWSHVTP